MRLLACASPPARRRRALLRWLLRRPRCRLDAPSSARPWCDDPPRDPAQLWPRRPRRRRSVSPPPRSPVRDSCTSCAAPLERADAREARLADDVDADGRAASAARPAVPTPWRRCRMRAHRDGCACALAAAASSGPARSCGASRGAVGLLTVLAGAASPSGRAAKARLTPPSGRITMTGSSGFEGSQSWSTTAPRSAAAWPSGQRRSAPATPAAGPSPAKHGDTRGVAAAGPRSAQVLCGLQTSLLRVQAECFFKL